jgi:hypothetical protein
MLHGKSNVKPRQFWRKPGIARDAPL